jgi:hypothetical protein
MTIKTYTNSQKTAVNQLFSTIANASDANGNFSSSTILTKITDLEVPNIYIANTLSISNVSGLKISGGTAGQLLATYANGQTYWTNAADPNAAGTVTQVTTGGSALGFSLSGGPITTTGTITLSGPNATALRSSLGIGNVANIALNGQSTNYLKGDGSWGTVSGGNGTVTSVSGTGSGLGISLSGTVTTSGSLSLSVPTATDMRTNLGLGNIATINATGSTTNFLRADGTWQPVGGGSSSNVPNLNGSTTQFLRGDGSWVVPSGGSGGGGTVTSVGSNGSGLGFSLTGTVTSSGNLTLITPTTTSLRSTLGIGNVANVNLNGSASQVLYGNGVFAAVSGGGSSSNVPNLTGNTQQWLRGDGWATLGNIATLNLDGNASNILYGNGTFAAPPQQTVYTAGNNISITANAISMDTLKFAKEAYQLITLPSTGTIDVDVLTNSIVYNTANATTAVGVNIRGNSATTLNTVMATGQALTATVMLTCGPTPQGISSVTVDGTAITPKMIAGGDLTGIANSIVAYTFTVFKTAATPSWTVIGSKASYK